MARLKRKSVVLETARQRLAGLKQISPKPNFAPPLTEAAYETEINAYSNDLDSYNGELAALDETTNLLDAREHLLADLNQRIVAAVKGQYGPDSNELELVGGVRRSDRKKAVRTPKAKGA
jgi:hypothetical protein